MQARRSRAANPPVPFFWGGITGPSIAPLGRRLLDLPARLGGTPAGHRFLLATSLEDSRNETRAGTDRRAARVPPLELSPHRPGHRRLPAGPLRVRAASRPARIQLAASIACR